jgi:hypothetical protein
MKLINMHKTRSNKETDVKIDRTTKWGNPFSIDAENNRLTVIWKYVPYVLGERHLINDLGSLEGKNLACWCYPDPCHGHVLQYLVSNPGRVDKYKRGKLTAIEIATDIFNQHGWKIPKRTVQGSFAAFF